MKRLGSVRLNLVMGPAFRQHEPRGHMPRLHARFAVGAALLLLAAGSATAQSGAASARPELSDVAGCIACTAAGIKPGDVVVVAGGSTPSRSWRPSEAAGMVYLGVGGNEMLGGRNRTQGGYHFPIVGATVVADGKLLVRDGRLAQGRPRRGGRTRGTEPCFARHSSSRPWRPSGSAAGSC